MSLFQVDDDGQLFISPALTEWEPLEARGIDTVLDHCCPKQMKPG
jgi:hypothetical protein